MRVKTIAGDIFLCYAYLKKGFYSFKRTSMNSQLKKGLITGGIVGGVLTGLFMSEKGKELRKEALTYAAELYKELEKKAEHLTELTQDKYNELVDMLVKEFAKKKEMAEDLKDQVVKRLKAQWEHLEIEGLARKARKEFDDAKAQTKEAYQDIVDTVVEKYAEEKAMGLAMKKRLTKEIMERYNDIKEQLAEDKK